VTAQATPRLVADACLVLKWQLNDEEDMANALALRDDFLIGRKFDLFAPGLLMYELINGVRTAERSNRMTSSEADEALQCLVACRIALEEPDAFRILELARAHGISPYDAAYVTLAEALSGDLWTADRPLFDAVSLKLPWVHWVAEYPGRP
jgi:predicted nucleic acid-binding protein